MWELTIELLILFLVIFSIPFIAGFSVSMEYKYKINKIKKHIHENKLNGKESCPSCYGVLDNDHIRVDFTFKEEGREVGVGKCIYCGSSNAIEITDGEKIKFTDLEVV